MKPYWYDYILPVGIKVNPADYPFQRIIPLFEEVEENQVDREKAEAMLDELKKYIENDR